MSKILLIAAAALLLGSAALSYLNKGKMNARADEIKRVNGVASAAQSEATRARATAKEADKKLAEQTSKAAELQQAVDAKISDLAKVNDQLVFATKNLTDKEAEVTRLNDTIKQLSNGKPVVAAGAGELNEQVQKLTLERDELKTVKEGLENRAKGLESQISEFQKEKNMRASLALKPGLSGRVLAVDRNWNFVVLSLGDRNGMVNNAQMVVRRGESVVGRVRITSVEPSQSIADIVPNSVPPGVSVQAGDMVIYPSS